MKNLILTVGQHAVDKTMKKTVKICMAGFGNVGRNFCKLIQAKQKKIDAEFGCRIIFTGICTRSMGAVVNPRGIDIDELILRVETHQKFDTVRSKPSNQDAFAMIENCGADVFCELSSLSIADGQPAASYIESAFNHGMHVISANKGPEACHYKKLMDMAQTKGLEFLFETIVMDGTPVFNLVKFSLPGVKIRGIRGILNSTSNFVLCQLEQGIGYDQAIKEAQRIGVAETDPSMDMNGLDGAAKICCLANVLMNACVTPKDVLVESLAGITTEDISKARNQGYKIRYICEARMDQPENKVLLSVKPQKIPIHDPYSSVEGTSSMITFYTDLAGEISIVQTNPTLLQTAYGVYSDLLTLLKPRHPCRHKSQALGNHGLITPGKIC